MTNFKVYMQLMFIIIILIPSKWFLSPYSYDVVLNFSS